jgi:hypothetical protein
MFRFFGHDVEPVLPAKEGKSEHLLAGIHLMSHYRRGVVGSHRDEVPPDLLCRLNAIVDRPLFERYGWAV